MSRIVLPYNWNPRPYQQPAWDYLSSGGKRCVLKFHRRAGKDEIFLNHVACAAHERVGNYWYMLPEFSQARKSMWDAIDGHSGLRRIDKVFPKEIRETTRENEMMIKFKNGSTFQLVGSDSFNSLVGSPPVGLVFSEYALSQPSAWGYLMPILEENGGWAGFNSTPRGKNHFKKLCEFAAKEPGWFFSAINADQSGIFSPEQLLSILRQLQAEHGDEYGMALFQQEYYVSFEAAMPGSIWGDCISKLETNGRIGAVPHMPGWPVFTGWDLGYDDDTTCWFYQMIADEIHVIDYVEDNFKDVEFYYLMLKNKHDQLGYRYGTHWFPHDARPRTLAAGGKSILQQFNDLNGDHGYTDDRGDMGRFAIAPRLDVQEGIQAARATFQKCRFDADKCEIGIDHLKAYRREYDEEDNVFSSTPKHDGASHACLVSGSIIKTERGDIQIENVIVGDRVWTPAGFSDVLNAGPVKVSDSLIEITTNDGKQITCTPEHKILTQRGFEHADGLRYNDSIFTGKELSCYLIGLLSTVTNLGFRAFITGETTGRQKGRQTFTERFGSFITGQFQKVSTFITQMKTHSTMKLATCDSLSGASIKGFTLSSELKKEALDHLQQKHFVWLHCGILQKPVKNGTLNTVKVDGKIVFQRNTHAQTAVQSLNLPPLAAQSYAHNDANSTPERKLMAASQDQSKNRLSAFVRNAASTLCRLILARNTATKIVKLNRLDGDKGRKLVFDLTVKKNACYQANGLLVSNSDGFRTVAVSWRKAKAQSREISPMEKMMGGNVTMLNFGQIKDAHLRRMRSQREDL